MTSVEDDGKVDAAIRDLVERANIEAHKLNATDDNIYKDYATAWQDLYGSVGEESIIALKDISKRYDPSQLFQNATPGGFELTFQTSAKIIINQSKLNRNTHLGPK